jgi:hypothetical protein
MRPELSKGEVMASGPRLRSLQQRNPNGRVFAMQHSQDFPCHPNEGCSACENRICGRGRPAISRSALASPGACHRPGQRGKLRKAVAVAGILQHERAFQRIANNNDGTRASGTPGYNASADYVIKKLRKAGYKVKRQTFTFPFFRELAPSELSLTSPNPRDIETSTFTYSGSGTVTGQVVPTNDIVILLTPQTSSTSGCEPADFPAAPSGPAIALIQRVRAPSR